MRNLPMTLHPAFDSAYRAAYIDLPSGGNDYEVGGEYGCYQTSVGISPGPGAEYSVGFHSPEPGMALMSALLSTPGRYQLCVIERGTTYVGDVREPLSFTELTETRGMVREAIPVISRELLVLITYCDIVAVGKSGLAWQTSQIAVDGFSVKTVDGDRITGVSDADWHPAPFSVRLSDGFLFGGNQT
jgi:hypothetical protein